MTETIQALPAGRGAGKTLIADSAGQSFGVIVGPKPDQAEELTRRIVACFNACRGLTVDELEDIALRGDVLVRASFPGALHESPMRAVCPECDGLGDRVHAGQPYSCSLCGGQGTVAAGLDAAGRPPPSAGGIDP
jgi:hypothetical protein